MKNIFLILLVFLLLGCTNNKELEGYWYGESKYKFDRSPTLIKFKNSTLIDFFGVTIDTVNYTRIQDIIRLQLGENEVHEFKIKLNKDKLSTFDSQSDSLIINLKKSEKDNFVFDYLNDKSLIIDLPIGRGLKKTFGHQISLNRPLYLTYKDNKLASNFLDTTVIVDSNYYKFLFSQNVPKYIEDRYLNSQKISLIADKNIKISDFNLLINQLKIVGYSRIDYFMNSDSYDKVNLLPFRLRYLTQDEFEKYNTNENPLFPVPPSTLEYLSQIKDTLLIVEVDRNIIKFNDSTFTEDEFKEFLETKISVDSKFHISYYITDNSTYQDFINFNDIVLNSYYDLRDGYLISKYGFSFRKNHGIYSKENQDAQKKYPMRFGRINLEEFDKLNQDFEK